MKNAMIFLAVFATGTTATACKSECRAVCETVVRCQGRIADHDLDPDHYNCRWKSEELKENAEDECVERCVERLQKVGSEERRLTEECMECVIETAEQHGCWYIHPDGEPDCAEFRSRVYDPRRFYSAEYPEELTCDELE